MSSQMMEGVPYLCLWESEVSPDKDDPGTATPDEAGVALEIPGLGVHEVVFESATDDTSDVGGISSQADCLLSQSGRSNFSGKSPAYNKVSHQKPEASRTLTYQVDQQRAGR